MSSKILYQLKSSKTQDIINFEGSGLRYIDLKREIASQKQLLGDLEEFDLVVIDKTSGHIYQDENEVVPKNTDLSVQRIPYNSFPYHKNQIIQSRKTTGKQIKIVKEEEDIMKAEEKVDTDLGADLLKPRDEDDEDLQKLRQVAHFARDLRGTTKNQNRNRKPGAGFPLSQAAQQNQRSSVGIPKSFIMQGKSTEEEEEGNEDEEMVDSNLMNQRTKKEKNAWGNFGRDGADMNVAARVLTDDELRSRLVLNDIPKPLRCPLTGKLLKEAVFLPCCYKTCSYSDLHAALIKENFDCPLCGQRVDQDAIKPNNELRELVEDLLAKKRVEFQGNNNVGGVQQQQNFQQGMQMQQQFAPRNMMPFMGMPRGGPRGFGNQMMWHPQMGRGFMGHPRPGFPPWMARGPWQGQPRPMMMQQNQNGNTQSGNKHNHNQASTKGSKESKSKILKDERKPREERKKESSNSKSKGRSHESRKTESKRSTDNTTKRYSSKTYDRDRDRDRERDRSRKPKPTSKSYSKTDYEDRDKDKKKDISSRSRYRSIKTERSQPTRDRGRNERSRRSRSRDRGRSRDKERSRRPEKDKDYKRRKRSRSRDRERSKSKYDTKRIKKESSSKEHKRGNSKDRKRDKRDRSRSGGVKLSSGRVLR